MTHNIILSQDLFCVIYYYYNNTSVVMNKKKICYYLPLLFRLARELHRNLVVSERRINQHATSQRYRKIQEISDAGGVSRSILHKKVRQVRASPSPPPNLPPPTTSTSHTSTTVTQNVAAKSSNNNVGMYLPIKIVFYFLFYFS